MSTDRVDKKWQAKGLEAYTTEAILGTLSHYGISTDEAAFKQAAEGSYPMTMAAGWAPKWKGTGQFSNFLPLAIGALWTRWLPERVMPEAVGVPLLGVLRALIENNADVAEKAFKLLDKELPRLPTGEQRVSFMRELEPWLDASRVSIEGLIDDLAQKKLDQAKRLAGVSDLLFPERQDVVAAVLEARTGDKEKAKTALTAVARDVARPDMVRLAAVDSLVPHDAGASVFDVVVALQEKAVKEGSTAVLYALHSTTHLIGPQLAGAERQRAQSLIGQQHSELERLTGRSVH